MPSICSPSSRRRLLPGLACSIVLALLVSVASGAEDTKRAHPFDWQDFLSSRLSFVPADATASILRAAAPSPQDAGQTLYVDTSDPMAPGEVYAGPTDDLSSGAISFNNELIGYNGSGTFNHTGGTNTIGGTLFLGFNQGSSGTYNLSDTSSVEIERKGHAGTGASSQTNGGATLSAAQEEIGYNGTGTFNQSGGTNTVYNILTVGPQFYSGPGTYNLSAGTLSASYEGIGYSVTGIFNQSGGTNTIRNSLAIAPGEGTHSAAYYLSGTGALSADTETIGNTDLGTDTFTQTGGTNTVGSTLYVGSNSHNNGGLIGAATYGLSGTGGLSAPVEEIGTGGTCVFTQIGGTNTVSDTLFLGYTLGYTPGNGDLGAYDLSGTGALSAATEEVGYGSTGAFTQSGGANTVSGTLYVGTIDPQNNTGPGTYNLSAGTLSAANEYVGDGATGTFTQRGGANTLSATLYLGSTNNNLSAPGAYNLSGTGALSASAEEVGASSAATFTQTGGTNAPQQLYVAYGANGTYKLSAGALSASKEYLGVSPGSTATFIQSGGTNVASSAFYLGFLQGSGTYTLGGTGALSAPTEYIGGNASIFTQKIGPNTITNAVNGALLFGGIIGGGTGTYNLNGGTLQTRAVALNTSCGPGMGSPTMGTFNFNGGTLQATASNTAFMTGLTAANVQAGGAIIDSNGYAITVAQPLLSGVSSGPDGGLTKQGTGTLALTGASTYNGPTVVNAGTLVLDAGSGSSQGGSVVATGHAGSLASGAPSGLALSATSSVTVNAGGTLTLGAANQINPAATLILNANSGSGAGATVAFETGGYSQTLDALELSSSSIIDFASGGALLHLGNSVGNWTGTLSIWNWTGSVITGAGADEVFFGGSTSGLTEAQVLDIRFYSDSGQTFLGLAGYALGDDGEVVPGGPLPGTGVYVVPEPSTRLAVAVLLGLIFSRYRRCRRAI